MAFVDRRSIPWWLTAGVTCAAAPLALTAWTPLLGDLLLALLSLGTLGGTWQIVRWKREAARLPLEIAPIVGTGIVDGVRVYRFRVRLGRGREVFLPVATVSFVDEEDERYALRALIPADELLGPFVVLVPDPDHSCLGDGRFEIRVACDADGERWEAERVLPKSALREGWFGGIGLSRRGLDLDGDWTQIVSPDIPTGDGG